MTEWLHFHFSLSCIGEGNGNPLQCYCLENPRDGGAWWAAVHGAAQSQTQLKQLSSSSSKESLVCTLHWKFPEFRKHCGCVHTQLCLTFCDSLDCRPPDSSLHGILQARILEWVAISSSRGSSQPRDWTCISRVSCIGKWILYHFAPGDGSIIAEWKKRYLRNWGERCPKYWSTSENCHSCASNLHP